MCFLELPFGTNHKTILLKPLWNSAIRPYNLHEIGDRVQNHSDGMIIPEVWNLHFLSDPTFSPAHNWGQEVGASKTDYPPQGMCFLVPWLQMRRNIVTPLHSSLFMAICSVSARMCKNYIIIYIERKKYYEHYCVKRELLMYSI